MWLARVDASRYCTIIRMQVTRTNIAAGLMTAVVAVPLLYLLGSAFADGELRRKQAPFRIIFGDETFERLASGEPSASHYMGRNRTAPNFTLKDQDGKPWQLSNQRGKIVIMNFWTITCQPCIAEMPSLIQLAEIASRRKDVEVIAISTDPHWGVVNALFPKRTNLKVLLDPQKKVVWDLYGTKLYPETWVIDRDGIIRFRYDGSRNWADPIMLDVIETL
jgi:peroxiredoxin